MKKEELKAGVWVAQGPEINVLIHLTGKSPMLSVIKALNLNDFYENGEITELDLTSPEIQDILMYPEKYQFETLNTSSTVENTKGYDCDVDRDPDTLTEEFVKSCIPQYQRFIRLTNNLDEAKTKMKIWLKREHQLSLSQGEFFIKNKMLPYMKPDIIEK